MKKIFAYISLFVLSTTVIGQTCLPDGIHISTQEAIDNFQTNNPNCTEVEGNVIIDGSNITNLHGLNILTYIGGDLNITNNNNLTDLMGLENLTAIGGFFQVYKINSITTLSGLESLTTIGGHLIIHRNETLKSLTGLNNLETVNGTLDFYSNDSLNNILALESLTLIGEDLNISGHSLTNLSGLENLVSVGKDIQLYQNYLLSDLSALNNITSIDGYIWISSNHLLTNLEGLNNMTNIGEFIRIYSNDSLVSLSALVNINTIGGYLDIHSNYSLTSLDGLENIESASIDSLFIYDNSSLVSCEIQSICDYLATPSGITEIYDNAAGCNNTTEVEVACQFLDISNITNEPKFTVHPNPAKNNISINAQSQIIIKEVVIYNEFGQKVLVIADDFENIDISTLEQGIYIIEISTSEFSNRKKLVIN